MFDTNIKIKVISDFKYKDEYYLTSNTHLSFDIYDSTKIAELIILYSPHYEYKDYIELPSIDALPYHVKQQLQETYDLNKPADSEEYLPKSDKPFYETLGDTYSPYGASPYEGETMPEPPIPLADSTYENTIVEPKFPELSSIAPSVAEEKEQATLTEEVEVNSSVFYEEAKPSINEKEVEYSIATAKMLTLTKEELEDKTANEIKKALLEIAPNYDYTNKVEAIKYLLNRK